MALPKKLLRFADLKARGIAPNHPTLKRMIEKQGFPKGRFMGNRHCWAEEEVEAWWDAQPSERPKPRPNRR
jgi:predicted DNA-binding transcriptional regulator AlpA